MRLETLLGKFRPKETFKHNEGQKEKINAKTIDDFIGLLQTERMTSVSVISEKTKIGRNFVFSNLFVASNEQKDVRYSEIYGKLPPLKDKNIDRELKAVVGTFVTAQHRLKLIKLEVPSIIACQTSLTTGKPLNEEELQQIEDIKRKYNIPPFPISGELADL